MRNIILVQIHLMSSGIAPWYAVLGGLFSILVWNEQRPLELGLLGELEPQHARRSRRSTTDAEDVEDAEPLNSTRPVVRA